MLSPLLSFRSHSPRDKLQMLAYARQAAAQRSSIGFWVSNNPNRFLMVTRCRENLSSGEKRAARHKISADETEHAKMTE